MLASMAQLAQQTGKNLMKLANHIICETLPSINAQPFVKGFGHTFRIVRSIWSLQAVDVNYFYCGYNTEKDKKMMKVCLETERVGVFYQHQQQHRNPCWRGRLP
jgi:hypothetical protein